MIELNNGMKNLDLDLIKLTDIKGIRTTNFLLFFEEIDDVGIYENFKVPEDTIVMTEMFLEEGKVHCKHTYLINNCNINCLIRNYYDEEKIVKIYKTEKDFEIIINKF